MNQPVPEPAPQPPVVRMYTTTICAYCIRAKMLLGKRHIPYEEINVSGDHEKRAWLVQATGRKTVPQIFIHGRSIGGREFNHAGAFGHGHLLQAIEVLHRPTPDRAVAIFDENIGCARAAIFVFRNYDGEHRRGLCLIVREHNPSRRLAFRIKARETSIRRDP